MRLTVNTFNYLEAMVEVFGPKGLHCQNTCKFTQEEVTVELPSIQCKPTKIK